MIALFCFQVVKRQYNNFWLFDLHVILWGFQILNGRDFTGDITILILAIKIEY